MKLRAELPAAELLALQAAWLAPARSALLRRATIAQRKRVLDLGAGYGAVTGELARRAGGSVVALDRAGDALRACDASAARVGGDGARLPFQSDAFDLVFTQFGLLWMTPLAVVVAEVARVLTPGGVLVALEPDYGGLIESPPEVVTREVWLAALARAGADPLVGRKLPGLLSAQGLDVRVSLLDTLTPASPARLDFLRDLPLTPDESAKLERASHTAKTAQGWQHVAHLPLFLILATKKAQRI